MGAVQESRTLRRSLGGESSRSQRVGRFLLKREIARGGMGVVFEAFDPDLELPVAIKVLHPWSDPEDEARFRVEARVIARLQHPSIVRVHALGRAAGRTFLVLDYVDGPSLRQHLEQVRRLDGIQAAEILESLARAVDYAHSRGVVHRDIKPGNVLLPRVGPPTLVDFGLAKDLTRSAAQPLTEHGALLGTPAYMAPEQALGEGGIDPRTDVYGLGATLYRMLTGMHPYEGSMLEVLEQVVSGPVPAPSAHVEVDPLLDSIVRRCLAKDPAQRFRSAAALAEALAGYLAIPHVELEELSASLEVAPSVSLEAPRAPVARRCSRRRVWAPGIAALVGACAVVPLGRLLVSGEREADSRRRGVRSARLDRSAVESRWADAARPAPALLEEQDESLDPANPRGPLRERGEHQRVDPQAEGDEPRIRPRLLPGSRFPSAAVQPLADVSPRLAAVAQGSSPFVFGVLRESSSSSVAPEVSARTPGQLGSDPQVGEAVGELTLEGEFAPELALEEWNDPEAQKADAVAQALLAFEGMPAGGGASVPFPELLTLDGRAEAYTDVPLRRSLGDAQSALLQPFGGVVFSAHGRTVDWLFEDEVYPEAELPYAISSVAVGGGNAFVATSSPTGAGGGDVYRRTLEGRWELSFDGPGDHALAAGPRGRPYVFSWAAGMGTEVYGQRDPQAPELGWERVATLGPERPTRAVVHRAAVWVACSPAAAGAEVALYVGSEGEWSRATIKGAGKPKRHQISQVTALLAHRGNVFMTVGYTDARTGLPDGGELLACELGAGTLEFQRLAKALRGNDVPLSLAHNERTLYVGTRSGRLLHLIPDPKGKKGKAKKGKKGNPKKDFKPKFGEDSVPGSLGIHSLLPRANGALLLGQFAPASSEVVLRVPERAAQRP